MFTIDKKHKENHQERVTVKEATDLLTYQQNPNNVCLK